MSVASRICPAMPPPTQDINRCNCIGYYGASDTAYFFERKGDEFFTLGGMTVQSPARWRDATPEEADALLAAEGSFLF